MSSEDAEVGRARKRIGHFLGMDLIHLVRDRGGLIATWELLSAGYNRKSITDLVRDGALVRIRQGWYGRPSLDHSAQRAARVGGQLTCSSGARFWRLWVPGRETATHVAVPADARALRTATSYRTRRDPDDPRVVVHWVGVDHSRSRVVAPPTTCLEQIARCHDPEFLAIVAESALHSGLVSREEWERVHAGVPARVAAALPNVGSLSASGIESMFVFRMRVLGIPLRQQVALPDVGIVDVLIGDRLIVELDGAAFHRDDARDRRRDAYASATGYRVLRFLAAQVTDEWSLVERSVLSAVQRGDHLDPSRNR